MGPLLEQFASRKLGAAIVAMLLLAQADLDRTAAMLIAGIAAMHILCQTWLDVRNGRDAEDQPGPVLTKDGLLPVTDQGYIPPPEVKPPKDRA